MRHLQTLALLVGIILLVGGVTSAQSISWLSFRASQSEVFPGMEVQLLTLLNQTRREHQLPPLVMDESLRRAARAHSLELSKHGLARILRPFHAGKRVARAEAGAFRRDSRTSRGEHHDQRHGGGREQSACRQSAASGEHA